MSRLSTCTAFSGFVLIFPVPSRHWKQSPLTAVNFHLQGCALRSFPTTCSLRSRDVVDSSPQSNIISSTLKALELLSSIGNSTSIALCRRQETMSQLLDRKLHRSIRRLIRTNPTIQKYYVLSSFSWLVFSQQRTLKDPQGLSHPSYVSESDCDLDSPSNTVLCRFPFGTTAAIEPLIRTGDYCYSFTRSRLLLSSRLT